MKNFALILAILFCVSAVNVATAQLTKKEKKEWKKKLKKTSPEQFKRMYDENASLKSEVSSMQGQLSSVQSTMSDKDAKIAELVAEHFDLRPRGIIEMLDLLRPIYQQTAAYGHFGREEKDFTWEKTDKADALRAAAEHQMTLGRRTCSSTFTFQKDYNIIILLWLID